MKSSRVILLTVHVALFCESVLVFGFNVDVDDPRIFRGPAKSLFGFSVLSHHTGSGDWILVGSPNSTSECQKEKLAGPSGALYKCPLLSSDDICQQICVDDEGNRNYSLPYRGVVEEKVSQFLGMSLISQPGPTGMMDKIVVCGHLRANTYQVYSYSNSYAGVCYIVKMNSTLEIQSVEQIQPCLSENGNWFWCMAGASAHFAVDGETLMLGAPGAFYFKGSVITQRGSQTAFYQRSMWNFPSSFHQYPWLGYSLTSGHFSSPLAVEGVTGAPRYADLGRVYIFDLQTAVTRELTGEPVNTYFGASVEAVDLNNDGYSDLLVGAPNYAKKQDEGCVYVYINEMGDLQLQVKLHGSNAIGARFGSTIKNVGDLNKDGYKDVAIGAPYENESFGAVYIYHGTSFGINSKYSQRISGRRFGVTSFGTSLSGAQDLDGNEYPDLVVGAHQNDSVIYLRSHPVINMRASMMIYPSVIIKQSTDQTNLPEVSVFVCFTYSGINVGDSQAFDYSLEVDYQVSSILSSRVNFVSSTTATLERVQTLRHSVEHCNNHTLVLKRNVKDLLSPIPVRLSFSFADNSSSFAPTLNPATSERITKEIGFGRSCGDDDTCQTDLQLVQNFSQLDSGLDVIYLGGDSSISITAEVVNNGEEAHQAKLIINHPRTVVFEGALTLESTDGLNVKCEPLFADEVPYIECNIGNPMTAQAKMMLKIRLDISALAASATELNISLTISTNSEEVIMDNNYAFVSVPVDILADIMVYGASTPAQLVYKEDKNVSSSHQYLKSVLKVVKHLSDTRDTTPSNQDGSGTGSGAVQIELQDQALGFTTPNPPGVGLSPEPDKPLVKETVIGPSFSHQFEVVNIGPSRIPYSSQVNISIPWRTQSGDWLIFITQIQGRDGIEACDTASILEQQHRDILDYYKLKLKDGLDRHDKDEQQLKDMNPRTRFDCVSAECITIHCRVQPILPTASAVIQLQGRLWKHSFLKSRYGLTSIISDVKVQINNPQDLLSQPENHKPDKALITLTVSREKIEAGEIPLADWVIPVSVGLGVLLLAAVVLGMAKLGFFRRNTVAKMKKKLNEEADDKQEIKDEENDEPMMTKID
ncbi:integrin alpha-9-like isoform X2 [Asterias amurensis]